MPKLHIEAYTRALTGKTIFIACREGILRDHFSDIVDDIKFLCRQGIATTFFHNMPNRFSNQKHFKSLAERLPDTQIVRVPPVQEFFGFVLAYRPFVSKIIFIERKYLVDPAGDKINAVNTQHVRETLTAYSDLIGNVNLKDVMENICRRIDAGSCDRVHILPAGRHTIKHELFTIEGSGTLIANNFVETFGRVETARELKVVAGILGMYRRQSYLLPRDKTYFEKNRGNFYVTKIDDIIVGCAEAKFLDPHTVELGALAISTRFRNQRVGVFTVTAFVEKMRCRGYRRIISLTRNPRLTALYRSLGFTRGVPPSCEKRRRQSPRSEMYFLNLK